MPDHYKYEFKDGNKVVHVGITDDLERREQEHRSDSPYPNGHIRQIGNAVPRDSALAWENEQREQGRPTEGYF